MRKICKKALSLFTAAVLLLTTLIITVSPVSASGTDITYKNSLDLSQPVSVSEDGNSITSGSGNFIVGTGASGNVLETKTWYRIIDSTNTRVAGSVIYKTSYAITDLYITTHEHSNISSGGYSSFEVSSDGESWTPLELTRTQSYKYNNNSWGSYLYDYKITLDATNNYKYIRATATVGQYTNVPGIVSIQYNETAPEYANSLDLSLPVSVEETGNSITSSSGNFIVGTDANGSILESKTWYRIVDSVNARAAGSVVYKTAYAITDLYITTHEHSNISSGGYSSFEVSSDGVTWTSLELTRTQSYKYNNNSWGSYLYDYKITLDATNNYKYIRATATVGQYTNVPGIVSIQYNETAPEYSNSLDLSLPVSVSEDGNSITSSSGNFIVGTDANGSVLESKTWYRIVDSANARAAGSVVYKTSYAITDLYITTHEHSNISSGGYSSFEVSSNGKNWTPLELTRTQSYKYNNNGWGSYLYDYKITLDATDNYKYIRATATVGQYTNIPGIVSIKYNQHVSLPVKPKAYEYTVTPDNNDGVESTGTLYTGFKENLSNVWLFRDAESADITGANALYGKVYFHSEEPITDFNFNIFAHEENNAQSFGGYAAFYASSDGVTYEKITVQLQQTPGGRVKWKNVRDLENYGTFIAEDDIHYLCVELNPNGDLGVLPALVTVQYSTEGFDGKPPRPDTYVNTMTGEHYLQTESEGVLTKLDNGSYAFIKDGVSVAGSLIFKTGDNISDFDIRIDELLTASAGEVKLYASSDITNWTELDPQRDEAEVLNDTSAIYTYYNTFPSTTKVMYLKIDLPAATENELLPAFREIRYNLTSGAEDTSRRQYEVLTPTEDIEDLDLPTYENKFSEGKYPSLFKSNGMALVNNGKNAEYIGGNKGYIAQDRDVSLLLYTPNVRDFKLLVAYGDADYLIQVKAYGRTEQYGEETEIPLMRIAGEEREGFPHYTFRPSDRDNLSEDILYIRVELVAEKAYCTQFLDFTFFYEGEAPGAVPEDEQNKENPNGTDRTNVKTYNFVKNNMTYVRSANMSITGNGSNSDYIGSKRGILTYPDANADSYIVFSTEGLTNFWLKVVIPEQYIEKLDLSILVASEDNDDLYTEIPIKYEYCEKQPTGWKAIEFMPADGAKIPKNVNYLKVFVEGNGIGTGYQIVRLDYEYELEPIVPLPDFLVPDSSTGEKELFDSFEATQLTKDMGGKADDVLQLSWTVINFGSENGSDRVLIKDNYLAESYITYKLNDISAIEVHAYKSSYCEENLIFYVSSDGEDWIELTDITIFESKLYGGWTKLAYRIGRGSVPGGMHYVKVEIPELAGVESDLTISDIHILYNNPINPIIADDEDDISDEYEDPYLDLSDDEEIIDEEPTDDSEEVIESKPTKNRIKVKKNSNDSDIGLYIAIGAGILVFVAAAVVVWLLVLKKKRKNSAR